MANKSTGERLAQLAGCLVSLADLLDKWQQAINVSTPELSNMLGAIQELAFSCVPTPQQNTFGDTMVAISVSRNGAPSEEVQTQTATTEPSSVGGN